MAAQDKIIDAEIYAFAEGARLALLVVSESLLRSMRRAIAAGKHPRDVGGPRLERWEDRVRELGQADGGGRFSEERCAFSFASFGSNSG